MAKLIENNEMKGIQLKEGQTVLDVDGNEYLIEKGDFLQEVQKDVIRENNNADYARKEALEYLENLSSKPVNRKTYNELLTLSQNIVLYSDDEDTLDIGQYIADIRLDLKSEINTIKRLNLGQSTMQEIIDSVNRVRGYRNKKVYAT